LVAVTPLLLKATAKASAVPVNPPVAVIPLKINSFAAVAAVPVPRNCSVVKLPRLLSVFTPPAIPVSIRRVVAEGAVANERVELAPESKRIVSKPEMLRPVAMVPPVVARRVSPVPAPP